jgi:hypothetical protein
MSELSGPGTNTESQYGTIPQVEQPVTSWEVDYTGLHPLWKGKHFPLTDIVTYFRNESDFPAHRPQIASLSTEGLQSI